MSKTPKRKVRRKKKKKKKRVVKKKISFRNRDLLLIGSYESVQVFDIQLQRVVKDIDAHEHWVTHIGVLPSRTHFITTSCDKTAKLWNLILSDERFATGGGDRVIKIWSVPRKKCLKTLHGHGGQVSALAKLDNDQLASGSHDNTIRIWDTISGLCCKTLVHSDWISSIVFQSRERRLISGSNDEKITIWSLDSGKVESVLEGHRGLVTRIEVLSDEEIVSCGQDGEVRLWNTQLGQTTKLLRSHRMKVNSVALLPDFRVATCSDDCTYKLWDLAEEKCLFVMENDEEYWVSSLGFLENNPRKKERAVRLNEVENTGEFDVSLYFGGQKEPFQSYKSLFGLSRVDLTDCTEIRMRLTKLNIEKSVLFKILTGQPHRFLRKEYVPLYVFFKKMKMSWHMYSVCKKVLKIRNPAELLSIFEKCVKTLERKKRVHLDLSESLSSLDGEGVEGGAPRRRGLTRFGKVSKFQSALGLQIFNILKRNHMETVEETAKYTQLLKRLGYYEHFLSHVESNIEDHEDFHFIRPWKDDEESSSEEEPEEPEEEEEEGESDDDDDDEEKKKERLRGKKKKKKKKEREPRVDIPVNTTMKYFFEYNLRNVLFRKKKYTNLVLKSNDGEQFHVHREILILQSNYFFKLLNMNRQSELGLRTLSGVELQGLIQYYYTRKIDSSSLAVLFRLLTFSQEHKEEELKRYVVSQIERESRRLHDSHKFEVAFLHFAPDLMKQTVEMRRKFFSFWTLTFQIPQERINCLVEEANLRISVLKKKDRECVHAIEKVKEYYHVESKKKHDQWSKVVKDREKVISKRDEVIKKRMYIIYSLAVLIASIAVFWILF